MKTHIVAIALFLIATCPKTYAQDNKEFEAYAAKAGDQMQDAYNAKDIPGFQKKLNEFLDAYGKLSAGDKEYYKEFLDGDYYNFACTYAVAGDTKNALDYLEKSQYYYYDHLQEDHDMDNLRKEPRFVKFLEEAKKRGELYQGAAFKIPYKENLSDDEKIVGLTILWQQAKSNFVYFDHADIDWNQAYLDYLPKIKATKSTAEYYLVLTKFYSQLKDGHTNVYPPRQLMKEFYSRPPMFADLVEGRVFITDAYSDTLIKLGLVPGVEILKIDGEPVISYADKNIKPYESSSTPQDMQVREFSYALFAGSDKKPLVLECEDASGKKFSRTIPRTGYHDLKPVKAWYPVVYEEIGNVGYLAVNNFESQDIDKQFDSLFSSISKTKGLIIDIRNNGGGSSDIGYHIIRKLTDKPFMTSACKRVKYISSPQKTLRWDVINPSEVQPDGKQYYDKPVVVLVGPRTFSAAEDFTVAFDYMKRGKLIGQPTGGSTGQPISFDLPGGGMARVCGKRDTYPDGKEFVGIGIIPDITVTPTIKDLRSGRDAAKEKALEVLNAR